MTYAAPERVPEIVPAVLGDLGVGGAMVEHPSALAALPRAGSVQAAHRERAPAQETAITQRRLPMCREGRPCAGLPFFVQARRPDTSIACSSLCVILKIRSTSRNTPPNTVHAKAPTPSTCAALTITENTGMLPTQSPANAPW